MQNSPLCQGVAFWVFLFVFFKAKATYLEAWRKQSDMFLWFLELETEMECNVIFEGQIQNKIKDCF